MAEGEKKGFIGSKAFFLILAWLALGVVLQIVMARMEPKMQHACERFAQAYDIELHHGEGKHDVCHSVAISDKVHGFDKNLATSFSGMSGKMNKAVAWSVPNFLILLTLLWHFKDGIVSMIGGYESVDSALKQRRDDLERAIEDAKMALEQAEAKKAEYENRLANIDQEIERVRAEFRAEGEADKARIIAAANKQSERIKNDADFTVKQELLIAQYRLREEAAKLAVEVARRVIKEVINDDDRDRLLNDYLNEVMERRN